MIEGDIRICCIFASGLYCPRGKFYIHVKDVEIACLKNLRFKLKVKLSLIYIVARNKTAPFSREM